jgi:hypothetical protein
VYVIRMRQVRNVYTVVGANAVGNRPHRRCSRRRKDNITSALTDLECDIYWIYLREDLSSNDSSMKTTMNFRVR